MKNIVTTIAIAAASMPVAAFAHGGEDHGEAELASGGGAPGADGRRTGWGQTQEFGIVLKFVPPAAGAQASFAVFLSDYATNAPIGGAAIELELTASPPVKVTAEPAGAPGVYHAVTSVPPGKYAAVATVTAGERVNVVEIAEVDLSPAPAAAESGASSGLPWMPIGLGAAALAVLAAGVIWIRRRGARRAPTAAAVLLLMAAAPLLARGHGGEDHGEPEAPAKAAGGALPPGGVFVAKESQFLLGVLTAVAAERDIESRIDAIGRVIPRIDGHAAIAAPVAGRIAAVKGKSLPFIGDKVAAGQPLFVIEQSLGAVDSGQLRSQAIEARSQVAQARARRDQARRELDRRIALRGVVAEKEIQEAELAHDLANRELELAQQRAALFGGGTLQRLTVTSPIAGTVAEAQVSLGEQVPADQKVYTIIDASTLWVDADVFEGDVARVEAAGSADIRVEGRATAFRGRVYRIGQVIDPATRTVKVILEVANADGALRPGMFAQVAVAAGTRTRALAIPDAAVVEEGGRRFVYVKDSPEVFVRREVTLGVRDGDFWSVRTGVEAGDRVVVQGTYQLRTAR